MEQINNAIYNYLSKNDEDIFKNFLNTELKKWNFNFEEKYIQTESGNTFILESGHDNHDSILYLHGYGLNSSSGKLFLSELSSKYHVIVPDIMWQIGRSIPINPINKKHCQENYNQWILEILNYYKIPKVVIMGLSFGSWITMNFILENPNQIQKAIILSPAAIFAPLKLKLLWRQIRAGLFTSQKTIMQFLQSSYGRNNQIGEGDLELTTMVMKHCRKDPPSLVPATVFSDAQLRSIDNSILLVVGSDEEFIDISKTIQRANKLVSNIQIINISNAAHYLNITHAEILIEKLKMFLNC
jgi:pimeloyl-ACP methyl ester carboxylesterase